MWKQTAALSARCQVYVYSIQRISATQQWLVAQKSSVKRQRHSRHPGSVIKNPPSKGKGTPVTQVVLSLVRKTAALATSEGAPSLGSGVAAFMKSLEG
jgi:hypothetical protein